MTSVDLSTKLRRMIASEMGTGKYKSQEALLLDALRALADRRAAIEGIREGLADARAGRHYTLKEHHRRMLKRHPILAK